MATMRRTVIDSKVVEMRFDNKQFEEGTKTTLNSLKRLKDAIKDTDSTKAFEGLDKATKNVKLDGIAAGVEALQKRFSTFGIVGMRVIENITDGLMGKLHNAFNYVESAIVSGGIRRAMNIENAHFQLQALLKDEAKVQAIMDNAMTAVDGTAYAYDEAAKAASQFAASGLQAGEEMLNALKGITGVAAMTNSDFESISRIFTTVAGNGRLMGDQLLQLSSRGMNAASTLVDYFREVQGISDITEAKVRDMVSHGEISFEHFANAMTWAFGDSAKRANETFTGAMSNMKSALARIGAGFVSPLVEQNGELVKMFNALRVKINEVKAELVFDQQKSAIMGLWYASNLTKEELDDMFERIEKNGKVTGDVMAELAHNGINGTETIKKYFEGVLDGSIRADYAMTTAITDLTEGVELTSEAVRQFVIDGKVNLSMFTAAMETEFGKDETLSKQFTDFFLDRVKEITYTINHLDVKTPLEVMYIWFNSVKNIAKGVGSFAKPIFDAFTDVFLNFTAEDVFKFSRAVEDMTSKFKLSEKSTKNLHDATKGLLDVFKLLIDGAFALVGAFIPINKPLVETGSGFLSLLGSAGRLLSSFTEFVRECDYVDAALSMLRDGVGFVSGKVSDLIGWIKELVQNMDKIPSISDIFAKLKGSVSNLNKTSLTDITNSVDALKISSEGLNEVGLDKAEGAFSGLKDKVKGFIDYVMNSNAMPGIRRDFQDLGVAMNSAFDNRQLAGNVTATQTVLSRFIGFVQNVVKPFFADVTFGGLLSAAGGFAILYSIVKVAKALKDVVAVSMAVPKFFNSLSGAVKAYQEKLKADRLSSIADAIVKTSLALGILGGTIAILSVVDTKKMLSAATALAMVGTVLLGGFALLQMAINAGNTVNKALANLIHSLSKTVRDFGTSLKIKAWGKSIEEFAAAIAIVAVAIVGLGIMWKKDEAAFMAGSVAIAAISLALVGVSGLMGLMSNLFRDNGKTFRTSSISLIAMTGSMALVVSSLGKLFKMTLPEDWKIKVGIFAGMFIGVGLLATLLGFVSRIIGGKSAASFEMAKAEGLGEAFRGMEYISNGKQITATSVIAMASSIYIAVSALNRLFKIQLPDDYKVKLGIMAGMFIGLSVLCSAIGVAARGTNTVIKAAGSILSLAAFVVTVTGSLMILTIFPADKLTKGALALGGLLLALGGALALASKIEVKGEISKSIISMAAMVGVLTASLGLLSNMKLDKVLATAGSLSLIFVALGKTFEGLGSIKQGNGLKNVLSMIGTLLVIVGSLKILADSPWENILASATSLSMTVLAMAESFKIISQHQWQAGDLKTVGTFILMTAAVSAIGITMGKLANTNWEPMIPAAVSIGIIAIALGKAYASITAGAWNQGDLKTVGSFILMTGSIATIGTIAGWLTRTDWEPLIPAAISIGIIAMALGDAYKNITATSWNKGDLKTVGAFLAITAAMAPIGLALWALHGINWEEMAKTAAVLSATIYAFTGAYYLLTLGNWKEGNLKTVSTFLLMTLSVASIGTALGVLSHFDWKGMIGAAVSLGLAINALSLAYGNLTKANWQEGNLKTVSTFLLMTLSVIPVGTALAALSNFNWKGMIGAAASMGIAVYAFTMAYKNLTVLNWSKGNLKTVSTFLLMTLSAAPIGFALGVLSKYNWEGMIGAAVSMGIAINLFALAFQDITFFGWNEGMGKTVAAFVSSCLAIIPLANGLVKLAEAESTFSQTIAAAISLSALALAMSEAFKIISGVEVDMKTIGEFAIVAALMAGVALSLTALASQDMNSIIASAVSVGLLMAEIAAIMAICAAVGPIAGVALGGIGVMAAIVAAMAGLLLAFGIIYQIPFLDKILNGGVEVMTLLGKAIGGFFGGIISEGLKQMSEALPDIALNMSQFMVNLAPFLMGLDLVNKEKAASMLYLSAIFAVLTVSEIIDGIASFFGVDLAGFGTKLSDFMNNLHPFLSGIKTLKKNNVEAAGIVADMILKITAAGLLEGITRFVGFGTTSFESFGNQLSTFGEAIAEFGVATRGIKKDDGVEAARITDTFLNLAKKLQRHKGALQFITGDKSFSTFAQELRDLASPLKTFAIITDVIKPTDGVEAARITETFLDLAVKLRSHKGALQLITGDKSFSNFAQELQDLAIPLRNFAILTDVIEPTDGIEAARVVSIMADAAKHLANDDGLVQLIIGSKSLSSFGEELAGLASPLVTFVATVKDIGANSVDGAVSVLKKMAEISQLLNDSVGGSSSVTKDLARGGFFGPLVSTFTKRGENAEKSGLVKFSEDLISLATNLVTFSNKVKNLDQNKVNAAIANFQALVDLVGYVDGTDPEVIVEFAASFAQIGDDTIVRFTATFENSEERTKSAIGVFANYALGAVGSAFTNISTAMEEGSENSIAGAAAAFVKGGLEDSPFISSVKGMANAGLKAVQNIMSLTAGESAVGQFIAGLQIGSSEGEKEVGALGGTIGTTLKDAVNDALGIHSPSWEAIQTAWNYVKGLVNGGMSKIDAIAQLGDKFGNTLGGNVINALSGKLDLLGSLQDNWLADEADYWDLLNEIGMGGVDSYMDNITGPMMDQMEQLTNSYADGTNSILGSDNSLTSGLLSNADDRNNSKEEEVKAEEMYWYKLLAIKQKGAQKSKYIDMDIATFQEEFTAKLDKIVGDSVKNYQNLANSFKSTFSLTDALDYGLDAYESKLQTLGNTISNFTSRINIFDSLSNATDRMAAEEKKQAAVSAMSIFNELKEETYVEKQTLAETLEGQIKMMQNYQSAMTTLAMRLGEDNPLMNEIRKLGYEQVGQIQEFVNMTDVELQNYAQKFAEREKLHQQILGNVEEESISSVQALINGMRDRSTLLDDYISTMDTLGQRLSEDDPLLAYLRTFSEDSLDQLQVIANATAEELEILSREYAMTITKSEEAAAAQLGYTMDQVNTEMQAQRERAFSDYIKDSERRADQFAELQASVQAKLGKNNPLLPYVQQLGLDQIEYLKAMDEMTKKELKKMGSNLEQYMIDMDNAAYTVYEKEIDKEEERLNKLFSKLLPDVYIDPIEFSNYYDGSVESLNNFVSYLIGVINNVNEAIGNGELSVDLNKIVKFDPEAEWAKYYEAYLKGELAKTEIEASTQATKTGEAVAKNTTKALKENTSSAGAEIGKNLASGMVAAVKDEGKELDAYAQNVKVALTEFSAEMEVSGDEIGSRLVKACLKAIKSQQEEFYKLGKKAAQRWMKSLKDQLTAVRQTALEFIAPALQVFMNFQNQAYQAGYDAGYAFGSGILAGAAQRAAEAAAEAAEEALASLEATAGISSPAKRFRQDGIYCGEGFVLGITDMLQATAQAGKDLADAVLESTSAEIANGFSDDGLTIRPVMDMSGVRETIEETQRYFNQTIAESSIRASATIATTEAVHTATVGSGGSAQNMGGDSSTQNNYTFNQYNNSPKALSRIEIYRQTRNQFSQFKEVTSNT